MWKSCYIRVNIGTATLCFASRDLAPGEEVPIIDLLRPVILIVLVPVLIQLLILIFLILILVLKLKSLTYCKVTDCYSQAYDSTPFTERHPDLLTKYKFDCKCRSLKMRMRIISMLMMMMMTMVIE